MALFNKSAPLFLAAISIALWATLAALGKQLSHLPPFLLVGVALCLGGLFGLKQWRSWQAITPARLALGVYGLFGFHFFLFFALRRAPAIEANLINYLWPLLIVLLAPVFVPHTPLKRWHVVGGGLGFAGAALLMLGSAQGFTQNHLSQYALGYGCAAVSAFIWASYSLLTRRMGAFPSGAVGLYCLVSGVLSLLCHAAFEPSTAIASKDWLWLVILGAGPMGLAFYAWDAAVQAGDVRIIGALSYATPLLSTAVLWLVGAGQLGWNAAGALILIVIGAVLANR